jgi:hypothetical protein
MVGGPPPEPLNPAHQPFSAPLGLARRQAPPQSRFMEGRPPCRPAPARALPGGSYQPSPKNNRNPSSISPISPGETLPKTFTTRPLSTERT